MKKLLLVIFTFFSFSVFSEHVGIIGAMDKEVAGLKNEIKVKEIKNIGELNFTAGLYRGKT